jgi:p-aminobenzoyl-glutamate transporter AbgT
VGAVLAIVAFLIGVILVRPLMTRAGQVAQGMASARSDQERADRVTELEQLRARGAGLSRLVMALLLLTTVAMAVARYV